ncbi:MAG: sulfite exporter TauE/SafE family protein [Egibacteraceae bacterium]
MSGKISTRQLLVRTLPLGLAVGVLSGLFGIGGGALLIVGMLAIGFTQHAAHATSLAAIVVIAAAAVVPFALDGAIAPMASLVLVATAMAGAYVGSTLMHRLSEVWLRRVFIVFLILVAARMLIGAESAASGGGGALTGWAIAALAVLGLVTGMLSSVMGVGGGLLFVPALVLLFGFSQHTAEGTSLAVVIPTAAVGALRHARRGYTDWKIGLLLGLGGLAGGVAGAYLALELDGVVLQRLFALFLLVMIAQLARSGPKDKARGSD